ncbi:MAG TPA: cohesin domain-containing protein, partial [Nitrospiria bacterium]
EPFSAVTLSPAHHSAQTGEMIVHTVEVQDLGETYFSAFDILYNPDVIEFVDSNEGNFMNQGGSDPTSMEVALQDGIPGRLTVGLSRLGLVGDISGDGTLLTLRFRGLNPGITTISFSPPMGFKGLGNKPTLIHAWNNGTVTVEEEFF